MAVSKRLRFEVFRRDQHACRYCGRSAPEVKITIDHVVPAALGGTDDLANLVTACADCNSGKTSLPADAPTLAAIAEHQQNWKAAVVGAAEDDLARKQFANAFLDAWGEGELPPGWRRTIDAYRRSGLAAHMWDEIVDIALTKPDIEDRFRYACGIARNQVAQMQAKAAKALVGSRRAPAQAPDPVAEKQRFVAIHLSLVWEGALKRAGHAGPTEAQRDAVFNQCWDWAHDGTSADIDLFDVVFDAGCDASTDLAHYLPGDGDSPPPLTDDDYERGAGVLILWAKKWESLHGSRPTKEQEAAFLDQLVAALRAGHDRDWLLNAADLAGGFMSTDLSYYLPKPTPADH